MTQIEKVKPYNREDLDKKQEVALMFDNISGRYDFLNHLLSMGIDRLWRKKAIRIIGQKNPKKILDVATGTGDFAIAALKLDPEKVTGVDISEKMLDVGRVKMKQNGWSDIIEMRTGDSENLEFENDAFDAITVGFGVRNFQNLQNGLKEMCRVLKSNGQLAVLEFSKPTAFPIKQLYQFYFHRILPLIGAAISKDKRAYSYLHESVDAFPEGADFISELKKAGFKTAEQTKLMNGIASIYIATK